MRILARASLSLALLLAAGCVARPAATPTSAPTATPTPPPTAIPTLAPSSTAAPTATPFPSPSPTVAATAAAPSLEAALAEIEGQVARLRGRSYTGPVPRKLADEAGLRRELEAEFDKPDNREILAREEALYKALGLIGRDVDYRRLNLDLYTEQVLGFYDTEERRLVVVQREAAFSGLHKVTFAHELTHALQQQHFDIHRLIEGVKRQRDASLALSALLEGDAVLVQSLYMATLTASERSEVFREGSRPSPVFDRAPAVVREGLLFPYSAGAAFVVSVYQSRGWAGVDELYGRPPASAEQVLHPQKYLSDERPQEVALPDPAPALGGGWRRLDQDTLGEFYLSAYLRKHLDMTAAAAAAAGWGGDRYEVWSAGAGQEALLLLTDWDMEAEAREFFAAYSAFADAEGGPASRATPGRPASRAQWSSSAGQVFLAQQGTRVLILRAGSGALLASLQSLFPGF